MDLKIQKITIFYQIKIECLASGTLLLIRPIDVLDLKSILARSCGSPCAFFFDKKNARLLRLFAKIARKKDVPKTHPSPLNRFTRGVFLCQKTPHLFDYLQKHETMWNKYSKMMPFLIKYSNKMAHF